MLKGSTAFDCVMDHVMDDRTGTGSRPHSHRVTQ